MFGLSAWELLIVFLAILLLFGAKRLPEIGSSLGKGIREFKGSIKEIESDVPDEIESPKTDNEASSVSRDPASAAKPD